MNNTETWQLTEHMAIVFICINHNTSTKFSVLSPGISGVPCVIEPGDGQTESEREAPPANHSVMAREHCW